MLEHVPRWLGVLMRGIRAGHSKLVIADPALALGDAVIDLSSPAFSNGGRLPERFTADGEGVSPPLVWGPVPAATTSLVLIVEDPDAPAPHPFVHAIVWHIPADEKRLAEGMIARDDEGGADGSDVGRNSSFSEGWLPPDPPSGHGTHDYVFQLFALGMTPDLGRNPGRSDIVKAIAGNVIAAGMLVGTYSRGEPSTTAGGAFSAVPA
jgi:Raf kinase inhibitor-like YbhB/YbcL family protein